MKNDSIRSSLIELQSFLQGKIDVDPTIVQIDRIKILVDIPFKDLLVIFSVFQRMHNVLCLGFFSLSTERLDT